MCGGTDEHLCTGSVYDILCHRGGAVIVETSIGIGGAGNGFHAVCLGSNLLRHAALAVISAKCVMTVVAETAGETERLIVEKLLRLLQLRTEALLALNEQPAALRMLHGGAGAGGGGGVLCALHRLDTLHDTVGGVGGGVGAGDSLCVLTLGDGDGVAVYRAGGGVRVAVALLAGNGGCLHAVCLCHAIGGRLVSLRCVRGEPLQQDTAVGLLGGKH